jgi:hypothetical protein
MEYATDIKINEAALNNAVVEIKLFINRRLYEKKAITEEMFTKAKEMILKEGSKYISTS